MRPGLWLAYLGSLPHVLGVLAILLDKGQDVGGHNAVGFAEVVVNLLQRERDGLLELLEFLGQGQVP